MRTGILSSRSRRLSRSLFVFLHILPTKGKRMKCTIEAMAIHTSSTMANVPQAVFSGAGRLFSQAKIIVPPFSNSASTLTTAVLVTTEAWVGSSIFSISNITISSTRQVGASWVDESVTDATPCSPGSRVMKSSAAVAVTSATPPVTVGVTLTRYGEVSLLYRTHWKVKDSEASMLAS